MTVIDTLVKLAPVLTALSPVAVIYLTSRLGKRKSRRDDLLNDYDRVQKERDDYHDRWLASEKKVDELKSEMEKNNETKR